MTTTWMKVTAPGDGSGLFEVKYSKPSLGFAVTKFVDEETVRLLDVAKQVGRNEQIDRFQAVFSKG